MPDFESFVFDRKRIYTVDFGRVIEEDGRIVEEGPPNRHCPDVDSVGYHDEAFPDEHGPITSSIVGLEFARVMFYRLQISLKAKLFAVSADPAILRIVQPASGLLTGHRQEIIEFAPVSAGRTAIEIRYNWLDGPVLGRLYVEIYEPRTIRVAIHLVMINHIDSTGKATVLTLPDRFLGYDCPDMMSKRKRAIEIVSLTNETWLPHGIEVLVTAATPMTLSSKELGHAPIDLGEMDDRLTLGAAQATYRVANDVNVYFVPFKLAEEVAFTISGISAATLNRAGPDQIPDPHKLNIAGIFCSSLYDPVSDLYPTKVKNPNAVISILLAHELGHFMTLEHASNDLLVLRRKQDWTAWFVDERRKASEAVRADIVTNRRLLYPGNHLIKIKWMPWRSDMGYGEGLEGSFVTYRKLPANQDVSFEESRRARAAIIDRHFYGL